MRAFFYTKFALIRLEYKSPVPSPGSVILKVQKRLMKQLAAANSFHPAMKIGRGSERAVNFKKNKSSGPVGRPGPVGLNVDVIKG